MKKQTLYVFDNQLASPWPKPRACLWLVILLACILYPFWLCKQAWLHIDQALTRIDEIYLSVDARVADSIRRLADWLVGPPGRTAMA